MPPNGLVFGGDYPHQSLEQWIDEIMGEKRGDNSCTRHNLTDTIISRISDVNIIRGINKNEPYIASRPVKI